MLATHLQPTPSEFMAPSYLDPSPNGRVALLLNANAKKVSRKLAQRVEQISGDDVDVFFTQSLTHADFVVKRIIDEHYSCIVTGGGDGTVMHTIDTALQRLEEKSYHYRPRFGVLKLGTGNAIAYHLGANHLESDLSRLNSAQVRDLDLISVNGKRTTFGGFGWDAKILEDYDTAKTRLAKAPMMGHLLKTLPGYFAIAFGQTIPGLLINKPIQRIRVRNLGGSAFQLSPEGVIINKFGPGALVFDGETQVGCFGTIPYFGYKMKILPYANTRPGYLHLRLMNIPPLGAAARMRSVWNGKLQHTGLTDILLSQAHIEFEESSPMHLSGDYLGHRDQLNLSVSDPISCVQFTD